MKAATYQMDEGVKQGDMEAMSNFCIGINQANKSTHDSLQEKGAIILSGADDTYILGPPEIAFPEVKLHEERLALIGLKLNYSKMKCYIKESKKSEIYRVVDYVLVNREGRLVTYTVPQKFDRPCSTH